MLGLGSGWFVFYGTGELAAGLDALANVSPAGSFSWRERRHCPGYECLEHFAAVFGFVPIQRDRQFLGK